MKRVLAAIIVTAMILGANATVFAQSVTRGVGYNIVVNGQTPEFEYGEAINVNGVSMFTAEAFVSKFPEAGLTEENVKKSVSFAFEGNEYYALRDVCAANGLNVYWDKATRTVLIINEDKYEEIKRLINASNESQKDAKKIEAEFEGRVKVSMSGMGGAEEAGSAGQDVDMPVSGLMKIDLDANFLEYAFAANLFGEDSSLHAYDDGEFFYMNSGDQTWYKTESQIAKSSEMIDQMQALNPSVNALAEDLSIAGLSISEAGGLYTIEGNMYVSETFNQLDIEGILGDMSPDMEALGIEFSFDWPEIVYVKYVMDAGGMIKSMAMRMDMGFGVVSEGETVSIGLGMDINFSKFVIDGDFETVVPQSVLDAATDFSSTELPAQQSE